MHIYFDFSVKVEYLALLKKANGAKAPGAKERVLVWLTRAGWRRGKQVDQYKTAALPEVVLGSCGFFIGTWEA